MATRVVWDHEAVGSNPTIQTKHVVLMELVYMSVLETDAFGIESSNLSDDTKHRGGEVSSSNGTLCGTAPDLRAYVV